MCDLVSPYVTCETKDMSVLFDTMTEMTVFIRDKRGWKEIIDAAKMVNIVITADPIPCGVVEAGIWRVRSDVIDLVRCIKQRFFKFFWCVLWEEQKLFVDVLEAACFNLHRNIDETAPVDYTAQLPAFNTFVASLVRPENQPTLPQALSSSVPVSSAALHTSGVVRGRGRPRGSTKALKAARAAAKKNARDGSADGVDLDEK